MSLYVHVLHYNISGVVSGIVLLDGKTDDELESKALINAINLVDIYGGSWGPKDDGRTVDGPGVLGQMSFDIGATQVYINAMPIIPTFNDASREYS